MKEVNYEEYLALKKRVEELERRQSKEVPLASGWAYAVTELPIHRAQLQENSCYTKPIAYYNRSANSEAWKAFTNLAKLIHGTSVFHLTARNWCSPYYWRYQSIDAPRSHTALTYEQKLLSLEMLNELVPIYNKYYKKANPCVGFFDDIKGVAFDLQVVDENEEVS